MENKKLSELIEKALAGLTKEQKEKAQACKTMGELTALLGDLGVALPDEVLDAAAGGNQELGQQWGKLCTRCGTNWITPLYPDPYFLGLCLSCYMEYKLEQREKQ